jgi:poly-gamma-glutamate synthesis protein (capsule biosynthesis protein)
MMRFAVGSFAVFLALPSRSMARILTDREPFPSMYSDPNLFLNAISREHVTVSQPIPVTGISVPHHLLAADLIARGFWAAHGNRFDRIIIFSPNHFRKCKRPFATTRNGFRTVLGAVENDVAGSTALLKTSPLFEESDLFDKEHGIQALLPFVKWFFPQAKIIPIAISATSTRAEWDIAVCSISALIDSQTLLIQSTDFSHYLKPELAIQRDQETLNVIAANDKDALTQLIHPSHLDSKGCQYIQMSLQTELKSNVVVVASRNSAEYVPGADKTTSYIVEIYSKGEVSCFPISYDDQQVFYFCGDGLLGRWMTQYLAHPTVSGQLVSRIRSLTGGAPLIVNLEGALLDEPPEGLPVSVHCMHASLAIPILQALNVRAVSLANNHSFDLGDIGLSESERILTASGITPLLHGKSVDLGPFRVIPLNFIGGAVREGYPLMRDDELERLCDVEAKPPLVAFVHWGREYTTTTEAAEYQIAASLYRGGVSAIIGAHSHHAAERIEVQQGGEYQLFYSLGNFIFDQRASHTSGALFELRIFNQKTFAARLVPLPNLFELGRTFLVTDSH